jgi:hypothetical protein
MEYKDHKIVYRRYASLYFVAGVDIDEVIYTCAIYSERIF